VSALAWIGVALLGGCAAVARVSVDAVIGRRVSARLGSADVTGRPPAGPLGLRQLRDRSAGLAVGTFVINVSGSFILGLLDGLALSGEASVLIGTAAIGAYTTFSTWMLQTQVLSADGLRRAALLNVGLSILTGFAAVLLGRAIGTVL
jgi:CrcB protein